MDEFLNSLDKIVYWWWILLDICTTSRYRILNLLVYIYKVNSLTIVITFSTSQCLHFCTTSSISLCPWTHFAHKTPYSTPYSLMWSCSSCLLLRSPWAHWSDALPDAYPGKNCPQRHPLYGRTIISHLAFWMKERLTVPVERKNFLSSNIVAVPITLSLLLSTITMIKYVSLWEGNIQSNWASKSYCVTLPTILSWARTSI